MIPGPVVAQPVNGDNANLHLLLLLTAGPTRDREHENTIRVLGTSAGLTQFVLIKRKWFWLRK